MILGSEWLTQYSHPSCRVVAMRVDQHIIRSFTEFHDVHLFRNDFFGRVLVIDGEVQCSELDEGVYHSALGGLPTEAIKAAVAHPSVLIIGGGDGGVAGKILDACSSSRILIEDHDEAIGNLVLEHWPELGSALTSPSVIVEFGDGAAFLDGTSEKWDLVVADLTGSATDQEQGVFSVARLEHVRTMLGDQGAFAAQIGSLALGRDQAALVVAQRIAGVFEHSIVYGVDIPSFGGVHGFVFACAGGDVAERFRLACSGLRGVAIHG